MTNLITFDQLREFLEARESGRWNWYKNTRCKYVRFDTDTRTFSVRVFDRDDKPLSFDMLMYQYSSATPDLPADLELDDGLPFL